MNQIKWNAKRLSASALAVLMAVGAIPSAALAADTDVSVSADDAAYKYVYAELSWADYWKGEGVYLSGTDWTASSDEADSRGELDKGAFDVVTRATTNHGLHRGSFQCDAVIYGASGTTYEITKWISVETGEKKEDGTAVTEARAVLKDGRQLKLSRGEIDTDIICYNTDGTTSTEKFSYYEVLGDKYVPVAVKAEDYDAFCAAYDVTENGATITGGYTEGVLNSYEATAEVTANTNGLKYAEKQADGSFVFSARETGTGSGVADQAQKSTNLISADSYDKEKLGENDIYAEVTAAEKAESYGCFVRMDILGNYGGLGDKMYAVRWDYYGSNSTDGTPLASYGTKFAADNWMHKAMGIQLGLTDSLRCQLPEGTDGTGNWVVTVYAMGYTDTVIPITVSAENINNGSSEEVNTEELANVIAKAEALNESDYTAESWAAMKTELQEAKDELATPHTQATVDEAVSHLNAAIDALEKVLTAPAVTAKSKSYNSIKLSWNEVATATSYKVYRATSKKGTYKKLATVKTTTYTDKGVKTGKNYYYKIKATDGTATKTSAIVKAKAKLSATSITKAKNVKGKKVSLKWQKVSGANGYVVYRAVGNGKYKAIKTIKSAKKVSYTNAGLKKNKKYSYKVRAYRVVDGSRVYSASSAVKTVKVKK